MSTLLLDSFCKLSNEFVKENKLEVLNIPFCINEKTYNFEEYNTKDYLDVNETTFFVDEELIKEETVLHFLENPILMGEDVLYIKTVDEKSLNNIIVDRAVNKLKEKYLNKFTVIALSSTNLASKLLITKAIQMLKNKDSVEKIKRQLEKELNTFANFILLDDKAKIQKFNNKKSLVYAFGVKPIYYINSSNNIEQICKEEGLTNGINKIVAMLQNVKIGQVKEIAIQYLRSAKYAELLEKLLKKFFGEKVVVRKTIMDPASIVEYGMGAVIVAFNGLL